MAEKIIKDVGLVTAYGYAVSKGYTGTEEEFAEALANAGVTLESITDAVNTFLNTTVPNAVQSVTDEGTTQVAGVNAAGAAQVQAVNSAGTTQVTNVNNAGTDKVAAVNAAGNTQVSNVNTAGSAKVAEVEQKGEEVLDSIPADYTELVDEVSDLKTDLSKLLIPLELVATYDGKILRKTGMQDNTDWAVYQYAIPDNVTSVHIKTNFYGNVFIIFTDMAADGDFSASLYQQYPSSGYPTTTTVDADFNTNGFKYVWIPLYKPSDVSVVAKTSFIDIVENVSENSIIANNETGGLSDFNDAERNHIYVITSNISNIANYPPITNGGTLFCFASYNIDNVQLFVSNQTAIYIRRMWGTSWGEWKQIQTADSVQSIVNTAVNTALAGYYPFNILSAFKNITCIGDSLTHSQVYTGASASRQAYKPYPKVLADKCGAIETILATPGDTAIQAWNRNGENISQKDAQLTIIYLGTNGGLTDTISTDMVGDDYTQWEDTNTGCYGKLIAKSLEVGSRVVLIKVHSSSGNVATTNSVIERMATKFNIPFIENTYLSGTKYHSYPDGSGTNGTHYNDFGYAVFADQVINSISQLSATDAVKIIPM